MDREPLPEANGSAMETEDDVVLTPEELRAQGVWLAVLISLLSWSHMHRHKAIMQNSITYVKLRQV